MNIVGMIYLFSKYNQRSKDALVTHDYSVLAICLVCQLLTELCIRFF